MSGKSINIAIDGPAGAGKSTIAKAAAKAFGFIYVDTGALYRAIAYYALSRGRDVSNAEAVESLLRDITPELKYMNGEQRVFLNGEDVSDKIRTPEVSMGASAVSAIPRVRDFLFDLQKKIAAENHVVMDGRDIGSFVLPDAKFKFYLDASAEVRADRRCRELRSRGEACDRETVYKDIIERDYNDMHRQFSPLVKAPGAVVVDSSDMTIEQVVTRMLEVINA